MKSRRKRATTSTTIPLVNIPGAAAKKLVRRRTGLSGKPEPPWQLQRVLEFQDAEKRK
jgi:hypothetical protein